MKELSEEILGKIVDGISRVVSPSQIVLFGSYARGEAVESSDLDLMVVTRDRYDGKVSRRKQLGEIYRALSDIRIPKDILLFSEAEVGHWRTSTNHLIAEAYRDGKSIYEQP
ncbi:MAG: nucleotidyltransferase domain-containing protein [Cyanobacteria bacterium J06639_1]